MTTVALVTDVQVDVLKWITGDDMPSAPSSVTFGLLTAQPAADGTGFVEPSLSNGYARQVITFGDPSTVSGVSSIANTTGVIFGPVTTSDWPQVTYGAIFDGDTDDMIAYGPLAAARLAPLEDTISFGVGAIQLRLK